MTLRVTPDDSAVKSIIIEFKELTQLAVTGNKLNWEALNDRAKKLTLSPDESLQFGRTVLVLVPRDRPVLVEAAVFGLVSRISMASIRGVFACPKD